MRCDLCLGYWKKCSKCRGTGFVRMDITPSEAFDFDSLQDTESVFQMYRWLKDHGKFPADGGLMDQTAYFKKAVEFIDESVNSYSMQKEKDREEKEKANKAFSSDLASKFPRLFQR
jgi:hypothetical protein